MKKLIASVLTVCILLALAACGSNDNVGGGTDAVGGNGAQPDPGGEQTVGSSGGVGGVPSEPVASYETPYVSGGYVLVREEPDSARHTIYWYDENGRVVEHDVTELDDHDKIEAHFIYAYEDKDGGQFVTSTAEEDFLYSYYEYTYDNAGRMTSMARFRAYGYENPDYTEEYAYDGNGLLVRTTYKDGNYDAYECDAKGNLTREVSYAEDGTEISDTEYTLDEYGRVVHEHFLKLGNVGDNDWEWSYLWDDNGRITKLEARDEHNSTRFSQLYTYDESGNLTKIEDKHEGVSYYYAPLAEAILRK